jgi:hypothetical protein
MRQKILIAVLAASIGLALGYVMSQEKIPPAATAPSTATPVADTALACPPLLARVVENASNRIFLLPQNCAYTASGQMQIIGGAQSNPISMQAELLIPSGKTDWDKVTRFSLQPLAEAMQWQDDPNPVKTGPTPASCRDLQITVQPKFIDPPKTGAGSVQNLPALAAPLVNALSPIYAAQQKSQIQDATAAQAIPRAVIADITDYYQKFGDFAMGGFYNPLNQEMDAYILNSGKLENCPAMMQHPLSQKLVQLYALGLKALPKSMRLTCENNITLNFTLRQAADYNPDCVTPLLHFRSLATAPITIAIP